MAAITTCSDFGAPQNKVWHCFYCLPIYFPWGDGTRCHDLSFLNVVLRSIRSCQNTVCQTSQTSSVLNWVPGILFLVLLLPNPMPTSIFLGVWAKHLGVIFNFFISQATNALSTVLATLSSKNAQNSIMPHICGYGCHLFLPNPCSHLLARISALARPLQSLPHRAAK